MHFKKQKNIPENACPKKCPILHAELWTSSNIKMSCYDLSVYIVNSFLLFVRGQFYVGFNSTMRRHWMTFLVEKCNIEHFFMHFSYFLWKSNPRTNKRKSFSKYAFYLHCIVEISLELTVKIEKLSKDKRIHDLHYGGVPMQHVYVFRHNIKTKDMLVMGWSHGWCCGSQWILVLFLYVLCKFCFLTDNSDLIACTVVTKER
jgi:hypothetical protein